MTISREEAIELLKKYIKNEKMLFHLYASEVVMKAIAHRLGKDEGKWGMAGLLHDIDVEITNADPKIHALEAVEILQNNNIDPEMPTFWSSKASFN